MELDFIGVKRQYCFGTQTQAECLQLVLKQKQGRRYLRFQTFNFCLKIQIAQCFPVALLDCQVFTFHSENSDCTGNRQDDQQGKKSNQAVLVHKAHQFLQRGIRAGFHFLIEQQMTDICRQQLYTLIPLGRVNSPGFFNDRLQCR